jgi:hypothetical protein
MNIFEFDKTTFRVHPTPEALLLKVLGDIWKRDKSKDKELALKELSFIWFYCDVRSHFLIQPPEVRTIEIIKDVDLPKTWKPDKLVNAAIEYYENNQTPIEEMYKGALIVSQTIVEVCNKSAEYIKTADDKIAAAQKLNSLLKELPTSMAKLKEAEKQYIRESEEKSGTKKGSQTFNVFENGLD